MITLMISDNQKIAADAERVEQCLMRIAGKDLSALEELYHFTSAAIYGYALSILKNVEDAGDVMHACYVLMYSAAESYRPLGQPMAWMITLTKNLCRKRLRERSRFADISQEEWEPYLEGSTNMSAEDRLIVNECLKALTDEERQIVLLHAAAGMKHREIAEVMDLPLSTVLSKYNRALKKCRKVYEGDESR